jgi:hypothetical protein
MTGLRHRSEKQAVVFLNYCLVKCISRELLGNRAVAETVLDMRGSIASFRTRFVNSTKGSFWAFRSIEQMGARIQTDAINWIVMKV